MVTKLTSDAQMLTAIECFCAARQMGITTFGRMAIGDPNLVANMRKGRSLTLKTANTVAAFMDGHQSSQVAA